MIQGGCFCGAIRYEADSIPFHETSCHCSVCRRTSGAPFVTWFSVPKSSFKFISGIPAQFRSSKKGIRTFCPQCGTSLTCELDDFPLEVDVTTCSLDNPDLLPPRDHTQISSKLPWITLAGGLPAYRESRHDV